MTEVGSGDGCVVCRCRNSGLYMKLNNYNALVNYEYHHKSWAVPASKSERRKIPHFPKKIRLKNEIVYKFVGVSS